MNDKFKQEIQKRLSNSEWDAKISRLVIQSYKREKNKVFFIKLSFAFLVFGSIIFGNFLFQNSIDIFQESLEIHETLEISFIEKN